MISKLLDINAITFKDSRRKESAASNCHLNSECENKQKIKKEEKIDRKKWSEKKEGTKTSKSMFDMEENH